APAALCSAIFLALSTQEQISDALTLPWLLVIPGAIAAAWVTSPRRAARFTEPRQDGRIRRAFAHAVSGLSILRSLLLASPLEHGLGFLGAARRSDRRIERPDTACAKARRMRPSW